MRRRHLDRTLGFDTTKRDRHSGGKGQPGQWHFRKHVRRHFRTAERFVSRVPRLLIPNRRHPERLAPPE